MDCTLKTRGNHDEIATSSHHKSRRAGKQSKERSNGSHEANRTQVHWRKGSPQAACDKGKAVVVFALSLISRVCQLTTILHHSSTFLRLRASPPPGPKVRGSPIATAQVPSPSARYVGTKKEPNSSSANYLSSVLSARSLRTSARSSASKAPRCWPFRRQVRPTSLVSSRTPTCVRSTPSVSRSCPRISSSLVAFAESVPE